MSNITTEWDYELKQEVFKVTGDKGYTHKTAVILKETDTPHVADLIKYYIAEFQVNVIRDVGSSHIVFYDNGDAIPFSIDGVEYSQYEWSDNTTQKTVTLKLTYAVEHDITVRYMGNQQGLPSKSQPVKVFEATPSEFVSKLENRTSYLQFNNKNNISFVLRFERGYTASETEIKPVKVYVDDELKSTVDFELAASAYAKQVSIPLTVPNDGLYTVRCVFEGDETTFASQTQFQISVGYDITVMEYPDKFMVSDEAIYAPQNRFKVRVLDWFGEPMSTDKVYASSDYAISPSATLDSEGMTTLTAHNGFGDSGCTLTYKNSTQFIESVPTLQVNDIEVTANPLLASKNSPTTVTTTITGYEWLTTKEDNITGVPVLFNDGDAYSQTLVTNEEGSATISYTPRGTTDFTISSKIGASNWETASVENVVQYWNAQTELFIDKEYEMHGSSSMQELRNGFKVVFSKNGFGYIAIGNGKDTINDYELSFDILEGRKNFKILVYTWNKRNGNYNANIDWNYFNNAEYRYWNTSHYIFTKRGNTISIVRQGTGSYGSYTWASTDFPLIMMYTPNSSSVKDITINNLKLKRL